MKQKDIILTDFNLTRGREQKGKRPAVIISGNPYNEYSEVVIVCPLTTKIKKYPRNIIIEASSLNGLDDKSEVLIGQIRTISIERLSKKIGSITDQELKNIFTGLDELCDRFK